MPNGNDVVGAVNNLVTAFDSYTTPRDHRSRRRHPLR